MDNWGKVGIHVACEMLQKVLMKNFKHPSPSQKTQSKTKQNKTKTKQYHTSTPWGYDLDKDLAALPI